jgi:hypothetical protein
MNILFEFHIELYVDRNGKLKFAIKSDVGKIYIVKGFKLKIFENKKWKINEPEKN